MRRFACLLTCLVLTACVATDLPPDIVSDATYATITDRGVGSISGDTPYSSDALAAVLPGAEIRTIQTATEDGVTSTLAAFANGVQVVQFYRGSGGTVGAIHGVTQHLSGPNGERIGMSMRQAAVSRSSCRAGRNLWRGMAVCPAVRTDHVTLVFSIPGYQGPFDGLPSAQDLENAELQRIVWQAP